jgi:hypothetical protein
VKNKYNQKWVAKLINKEKWAITLGQTTYYSCPRYEVSREWEWHEDYHKKQWKDAGAIKFVLIYLWYTLRYGYSHNPYEMAADAYVKCQLGGYNAK